MAKDEEEQTTDMTVFGRSVDIAETERLMNSLEQTAGEGGRIGDVSFMSFSGKRGVYKIGVDGREVGPEEPFLIAIPSFELGWMCWKGGKPVAKRMANISVPPIPEPNHDEFGPFDDRKGEGWFRARAITAKSLEKSEQVYFSNNSKSGVAAMSDLQKDVVLRMKAGQPCWPIVIFGKEEFESQGFMNYKPTFEIVGWVTSEDVRKLADPDVDPMSLLDAPEKKKEEAPEPQKRRRL